MHRRSPARAGGLPGFARLLARRARGNEARAPRAYGCEPLERRLMLATVHGVKFEDLDADGIRDAGEAGLGGWTIYSDENLNGFPDIDEPQSVPQPDTGAYSLTVPAGPPRFPTDHTIAEVPQPGWRATTPEAGSTVVTLIFSTNITLDFGNTRSVIVSGTKFDDQDADGVRDAGEPGLQGWTVYHDANDNNTLDAGEATAVTGADGGYRLGMPAPAGESGSYTVREVAQAGWRQTAPATAADGEHRFTLGPLAEVAFADFGNTQRVLVSGVVIRDNDGDGLLDAEESVQSSMMVFVDYNDNARFDSGEPSMFTDGEGRYALSATVVPGAPVRLRESLAQSLAPGNPTRPTLPPGGMYTLDLNPGQVATGLNFGNSLPALVSGVKFNDLDGDGIQDAGEPGLAGTRIYEDANLNGRFDSTEPAPERFDATAGLPTATIDGNKIRSHIFVTAQNPVVRDVDVRVDITHPNVSDLEAFLITPLGFRVELFRAAGGTSDDVNEVTFDDEASQSITSATPPFSNQRLRPAAPLSTFDGEDPNGQWTLEIVDRNESLGGTASVGSLDSWSLTLATAERDVVTAAPGGGYTLTVPPGRRTLREEPMEGWVQTRPASGFHTLDLSSAGGLVPRRDFGNTRAGSLSGQTFHDRDGDGVREAGEEAVGGFWIYHDLNDNGQLDSGRSNPQSTTAVVLNDAIDTGIGPQPGVSRSTLSVNDAPGGMWNLDVAVDIDHPRVSDRTLRLVSPAGRMVTLVSRQPAPGANFDGTIFDDDVPTPIASASPPYAGRFRPLETLSSLNDEPVNGAWTLLVIDHVAGQSGQLNSWSMDFSYGDPLRVTTAANPTYRFDNLRPGTHALREIIPNLDTSWAQTSPVGAAYHVQLAGDNLTGLDFGNRKLEGGGVRAMYFDHEFFAGQPVILSPVGPVDNFGARSPDVRIGPDQFSGIFEGELEVLANDNYSFYVGSDDGIDFTLLDPGSGQVLLHGPTRGIYTRRSFTPFQDRVGTVRLESGKRYLIEWRFDEEFGGAAYSVGWQRGDGPVEAIPAPALRPPTLPPGTPAEVRAVAPPLCPGHVMVMFKDASVGETFFEVQRATAAGGPFVTLFNLTHPASHELGGEVWIDDEPPALPNGQAWFYRVRAKGRTPAEDSAYSTPVAVTPGEGGTGQVINGTALVLPGPDGNVDEVVDNVLRLTENQQSRNGSWFLTAPRSVDGAGNGFTASFDFAIPQHTPVPADGFAFVIQRAGADALAVSGGGLGYLGMPRSLALKFDLYRGDGAAAMNQVGFFANGYMDDVFGVDAGADLANGHTYRVTLEALPDSFGVRVGIADLTADPTGGNFVFSQIMLQAAAATGSTPIDVAGIIGGDCALFGFTGATGGLSATQLVSNFRLNAETIPFDLAVNDAPVNAVPPPQSRAKDQALVFSAATGNAIVISDTDARGADVRVTLTAPTGLLTLSAMAGLTFETGDGSADVTMTFRGTLAAVNSALAGLRFEAAGADAVGRIDQLTVTTDDLGHTGSGGPLADSDTITVTAVRGEPGPTVVAVYLAGSRWTSAFRSALADAGLGSVRYGFAVPAADQSNEIPWAGIDRVSIRFDADVDVDADDLAVRGAALASYPVTAFAYDPGDRTATWTLGRPVRIDRLTLDLDAGPGGVRADVGTAPLDGEWDDAGDSFPSGDGGGGGDFRFAVNLLPADVDRDGRVTAADLAGVRRRLRTTAAVPGAGASAYTPFHDVTADGATNVLDLEAVRRNLLRRLPATEPVAPAPAAGLRSAYSVTRDVFGSRPIV
jgi:subtilisin-like proprotein convertase family protein